MSKYICKACNKWISSKGLIRNKKSEIVNKCPYCKEENVVKYIGTCHECLEYLPIHENKGTCKCKDFTYPMTQGCEDFL